MVVNERPQNRILIRNIKLDLIPIIQNVQQLQVSIVVLCDLCDRFDQDVAVVLPEHFVSHPLGRDIGSTRHHRRKPQLVHQRRSGLVTKPLPLVLDVYPLDKRSNTYPRPAKRCLHGLVVNTAAVAQKIGVCVEISSQILVENIPLRKARFCNMNVDISCQYRLPGSYLINVFTDPFNERHLASLLFSRTVLYDYFI